jgi:hypothetical protein
MFTDLANFATAIAPIAGDQIIFVASPRQAVKLNLRKTAPLPYPVLSSAGLADEIVPALAINALAVTGGNDPPSIRVNSETTLHYIYN